MESTKSARGVPFFLFYDKLFSKGGCLQMAVKLNTEKVLKRIDILEQELIRLKKEVLHGLAGREKTKKIKPSLFGSVKGGDITEEMIEQSKHNLFRRLADI